MYKVVIVEDEAIIRKGLIYSTDWAKLNCSIVGEAKNGVLGIEVIKKKKPDIVIVDLNMPVMGGLEMISQTYEQYNFSTIILTGYSDFECAKEAIRYGVLGYLLKPLDRAELKEVIIRAQNECDVRDTFEKNTRLKQEWISIDLLKDKYPKETDDGIAKEMLEFIFINYKKKIVFNDIVDQLNYSETFLNKRFKESVGTTFIEYLNRYRIQKAIELLIEGNDPIKDVAWKCGIGEYKYFGTVFKKYIGCSPKDYVKLIRN